MKKKLLFCGLFLFVAVFMLTGCGLNKITAEDFKRMAEEDGLTVSDITSSYSSYSYIKKIYIAKHSNGWKVEFYELDSEEKATQIYTTNKNKFLSSSPSTNSSSSTLTTDQGERYSLTVNGYYKHVCRIGDTFVYANINADYKDEAIKFLKKIGY